VSVTAVPGDFEAPPRERRNCQVTPCGGCVCALLFGGDNF
jgi:hypothetical protein